MAVEEWWRNPAEMTLGNIGLFTATELGCGFASCVNENLQMTVDMVCHYWPINDPNQFYNYEISCETNDDCSSLPNSRCDFNQNICISKM
ncbi:unnamed protein product [Dracunculus medinensis]|uniref:SCP domain-containing protein n=1 Tax=Dracunculus medinensis TaxID=318479 RepID=A0A0N4UDH2_DRAME|nr:unnamed protein product [Dracunculus medinensis]